MLNLCKKRESWDRRQRDSCTTQGDVQAQSGLRRDGRRHRRLTGGRGTDCGDDGRWERWWCYNYVYVTLSQQTDTQWHAMSQCWQPHTMVDQMLGKCPEMLRQRAGGLLVVSCSVQSCLQSSQISCARPGRQWTVSSSRAAVPSTSHVLLLPSWQHLDTRHPPSASPWPVLVWHTVNTRLRLGTAPTPWVSWQYWAVADILIISHLQAGQAPVMIHQNIVNKFVFYITMKLLRMADSILKIFSQWIKY